jgi:hypothetical protein
MGIKKGYGNFSSVLNASGQKVKSGFFVNICFISWSKEFRNSRIQGRGLNQN